MEDFPTISQTLRTIFNAENGLSEETSIPLYQRSVLNSDNSELLKAELRTAFALSDFSWKEMLHNRYYEVYYAENEEDAKKFAFKILWEPIFEN